MTMASYYIFIYYSLDYYELLRNSLMGDALF